MILVGWAGFVFSGESVISLDPNRFQLLKFKRHLKYAEFDRLHEWIKKVSG
jgi:hypothetical protein